MSSTVFQSSFLLKVAVAVALVALGDLLFFQWRLGGGNLGIYGLALLAGMLAARRDIRRDRRAWLAAGMAVIFAVAMIHDANLLAWTLFWAAAGMATLLPATGKFDDGWRWFQRLVLHGLRTPFGPIIDARRFVKVRKGRGQGRGGIWRSLPVFALPIIGTAIFLALFSAANPVLEKFLSSIEMPGLSVETIIRSIVWVMLGIMAWSLIHPRLARRTLGSFDGTGDLALPGVSTASVRLSLVMFNLLFALQNLMDFAYLGGLAVMPSGITLAEYAHRGAYPLIVTALLAGLFVIVTLRPGSATANDGAIRKLVLVWIAQNIVLVASSILRTVDYIEVYSLTVLRISALVWMVLVAIGLQLICWRLFAGKSASWLINTNLAAAILVLTTASFVDLGNVAAWWNIRHAREVGGPGAALDLCYLERLGRSSLLPLIALEQRDDLTPGFRDRVQATRQRVHDPLHWESVGEWTWLGQRRLEQAARELTKIDPKPLRPGLRGCGGIILSPSSQGTSALTADS